MPKKDKKTKDKFPLDDIDTAKIKDLLKEGQKLVNDLRNPPPPGDYVTDGGRGEKTAHVCSACGGIIEAVYSLKAPPGPVVFGPGGAYKWGFSKYRCSECRLLFDL